MKVAKLLALPIAVIFAITPIVASSSHSDVPVHTRSTWPLSDWFHPLHTSTWFMSDTQCHALYDLRSQLIEQVRSGDEKAVKAVLNSEVKEIVETSSGTLVTVVLKTPVKIEYYDAILPLAIEEAIQLGLPEIVHVLCDHAELNPRDTVRYATAAFDRANIIKKLQLAVGAGVSVVAQGAEKVVDAVVEGAEMAYDAVKSAVK